MGVVTGVAKGTGAARLGAQGEILRLPMLLLLPIQAGGAPTSVLRLGAALMRRTAGHGTEAVALHVS